MKDVAMHYRYWIKTAMYRYTPGGFGVYRRLKALKDPNYDFERDKHPVRTKHRGNRGWRQSGDSIIYRDYTDYQEYVTHQKQKLDEIIKIQGGFDNDVISEYRKKFYRRFRHLPPLIPKDALIVCLGARLGTEVEVLRDLGFFNAYGIDLNPGPGNRFVRIGDFMRMEEQSNSIDLLYSNCIDHVFDLSAFFREHARVIKPNGYALYDLPVGGPELGGPFESVQWDGDESIFALMFQHFREVFRVETDPGWKWVLMRGKKSDVAAHP